MPPLFHESSRLHTSRMSLSDDVDLEEFILTKDDLSGADIKAVCTEAGLLALRERRMRVTKADFTTAREKVIFPFVRLICCSLSFQGSIQKERGHAGRSISVRLAHRHTIFCPVASPTRVHLRSIVFFHISTHGAIL